MVVLNSIGNILKHAIGHHHRVLMKANGVKADHPGREIESTRNFLRRRNGSCDGSLAAFRNARLIPYRIMSDQDLASRIAERSRFRPAIYHILPDRHTTIGRFRHGRVMQRDGD